MAYFTDYFNQEDDDSNDSQLGPSVAGSGQLIGGASVTQAPGASAQRGPTKSGRYQNLNDYLNANEGNNFGQVFSDKINNEVNNANVAQQDSLNKFKKSVDAKSLSLDNNLIQEAISTPESVVSDPEKFDKFQKQRNASYQGAISYADDPSAYQNAYSATKRASDVAKASQSEGGRFALLGNYFGNPGYSQGQKSLDNLLVQNNPVTQQGIEQAKQNANQARMNFENQNKEAAQYASKKATETNQASEAFKNVFGVDSAGNKTDVGVYPGLLKYTEENLKNAAMSGDRNYSTVSRALNNNLMGNLSSDLLSSYGIDREYLGSKETGISNPQLDGRILDVNVGDYLVRNPEWKPENALSQQDYNRIAALSKLLDQENPYADPSTISNPNQYNFNEKGFVDAVLARDNQRVASLSNQDNIQSVINQGGTGGTFSYSHVKNALGHAPSLQEVADFYQKMANDTKVSSPISQGIKDAAQRVADSARKKIVEVNNSYNWQRRFN